MSKNTSTIKETKNVAGLLCMTFEHEVKSTKYTFKWEGPPFPREEWQKILAFFKWTYDETKSESQVRLYVNKTTRTWAAWAYPQNSRTGMTSNERQEPWGPEQFVFDEADGWVPFGTVHHHCSASAFQSGVDEKDEITIKDGLHITVGHLDKPLYDIDARLYIGGRKLNGLDLCDFWQIDGVIAGLPQWVKDLLPEDADAKAAKRQMGEPAPADCVFPEVWRTNLIYEAPPVHVPRTIQTYSAQNLNNSKFGFKPSYITRSKPKLPFDLARATEEIEMWMVRQDALKDADPATKHEPNWDMEAVVQTVYDLAGKLHDTELELIDILCRNDVLPEDWMSYAEKEIERRAQRELEEEIKKGDNKAAKDMTEAELENWRYQNGYGA